MFACTLSKWPSIDYIYKTLSLKKHQKVLGKKQFLHPTTTIHHIKIDVKCLVLYGVGSLYNHFQTFLFFHISNLSYFLLLIFLVYLFKVVIKEAIYFQLFSPLYLQIPWLTDIPKSVTYQTYFLSQMIWNGLTLYTVSNEQC